MALQGDGKLVVAGSWGQTDFSAGAPLTPGGFTVARFNPDGSLDASFAQGGFSNLAAGPEYPQIPPNGFPYADAVTINPDGTILAQGESDTIIMVPLALVVGANGQTDLPPNQSYSQAVSVLYNPDGSLDQSFGVGGILVGPEVPLGSPMQGGPIVAPLPGEPVQGGPITVDPNQIQPGPVQQAPPNPNPAPQPPNAPTHFVAFRTVAEPDGKTIEAGLYMSQDDEKVESGAIVARFNADGSFDTSFGQGGQVSLGGSYFLTGILLQPDGKVVVTGGSAQGFALWRFNSDGSPDAGFGSGGEVQVLSGDVAYWSPTATLQSNGELVVTAFDGGPGPAPRVTLAQFHADGSLDTFFVPGLTIVPGPSAGSDQGSPGGSPASVANGAVPVPTFAIGTGNSLPAGTATAPVTDSLATETGATLPVATDAVLPTGTGNTDPSGTRLSGGGGDSPVADDQTTDFLSLPSLEDAPVDAGASQGDATMVAHAGPYPVLDAVFTLLPLGETMASHQFISRQTPAVVASPPAGDRWRCPRPLSKLPAARGPWPASGLPASVLSAECWEWSGTKPDDAKAGRSRGPW